MRKNIVAGNWKMNLTRNEGLLLIEGITNGIGSNGAKVIVAPAFPFIAAAVSGTESTAVSVAAQNCHHEPNGAFTGEVSAEMLASFNCEYCIVGHSERREFSKENDELINGKIKQLFANDLKPIFCCGESEQEREAGKHLEIVASQIQAALQGFVKEELLQCVIAYEPVWAIGTGKTASPEQAQEMHAFIRAKLSEVLGDDAENISIIYGGSVNPENAKELFAQKDIDGGLIGGASLNAPDFLAIINSF